MIKWALRETNPYLHDPGRRRAMFAITVCTSTGVEGVRLTPTDLEKAAANPPRPTALRGGGASAGSRR